MKEKTLWKSYFDNTQDIQCVTCLDAYVLEYYICDCRVRVERNDNKFNVSIIAYDENGKRISQKKFDKAWKEKNIYSQDVYKKFVSGHFFHQCEKPCGCKACDY